MQHVLPVIIKAKAVKQIVTVVLNTDGLTEEQVLVKHVLQDISVMENAVFKLVAMDITPKEDIQQFQVVPLVRIINGLMIIIQGVNGVMEDINAVKMVI